MKILTPFILLLASVGLFLLVIKPHYTSIGVIRDESKQYDDAITRAKAVTAKRDELVARRDSFSPEDVARLNTLLPANVDNVRLAIDIDNLASHYGTTIKSIKFSSQDTASAGAIGPDTKPYGTVGMSFMITLTYDQFRNFLADLEQSLRILDITSVSFKPSDTSPLYDFSVSLSTYWLK